MKPSIVLTFASFVSVFSFALTLCAPLAAHAQECDHTQALVADVSRYGGLLEVWYHPNPTFALHACIPPQELPKWEVKMCDPRGCRTISTRFDRRNPWHATVLPRTSGYITVRVQFESAPEAGASTTVRWLDGRARGEIPSGR